MAKFAFVDVQNTETTALKWLGFSIDWQKLTEFLIAEWSCKKVFYYLGIQEGDSGRAEEFGKLQALGATVRPKYYFVHKVSDKIVNTNCPLCGDEIAVRVDMGYTWKCNCDVELTADVLDHAVDGNEIVLFTGDGDFEFLIEKVLSKVSTNVSVVSSSKPRLRAGKNEYRLSKKFRKMNRVTVLEMDNLKMKIKSEILVQS